MKKKLFRLTGVGNANYSITFGNGNVDTSGIGNDIEYIKQMAEMEEELSDSEWSQGLSDSVDLGNAKIIGRD
jgi:hypothetical protein